MDVQWPQGNRCEHPTVERFKRFPSFLVGEGMESPDFILRIFPTMVGESIQLCEILFESMAHGWDITATKDWGQFNPWNPNLASWTITDMSPEIRNHIGSAPSQNPECSPPPLDDRSQAQTGFLCDLAKGNAFYPGINEPPVPVLAAFGPNRLHQCRLEGMWDFERAATENRQSVVRSYRNMKRNDMGVRWEDVVFQFGERAFVCGDSRRIIGYAASYEEDEKIVRDFNASYRKDSASTGGRFQLIRKNRYGIECENVVLEADTVLGEQSFSLHYPEGTDVWHKGFVEKLANRKHGLSILEGKPGTGKTSYLRHLMGSLNETHRFYFIAPSNLGILSEPDFIGFWGKERQLYADYNLAVILEDADAALMTRATDNRAQVSAILNLSDGMLADFLRLQIICTINCRADDIDQAFLRPGRLLCHRIFERLDPSQAARLAASIGTNLPHARDYSLAEVFAGHGGGVLARPHIGFGGTN